MYKSEWEQVRVRWRRPLTTHTKKLHNDETWEKERHKTKTDTFFNGLHIWWASGFGKNHRHHHHHQQKIYVFFIRSKKRKNSPIFVVPHWSTLSPANKYEQMMFYGEDLLIYASHNFWHIKIKFSYFLRPCLLLLLFMMWHSHCDLWREHRHKHTHTIKSPRKNIFFPFSCYADFNDVKKR